VITNDSDALAKAWFWADNVNLMWVASQLDMDIADHFRPPPVSLGSDHDCSLVYKTRSFGPGKGKFFPLEIPTEAFLEHKNLCQSIKN
jgi:hypothetical protein